MHPFLKSHPATAQSQRETPGEDWPISYHSLPSHHAVTVLDIDITEACNLGCVYCFKNELYGKYMSWSTLTRTFDWLIAASREHSQIHCNFMGGEPTLRWKDIERFVPWARRRAALRKKTVTFSMTSNMTLWTDAIRKFVDLYNFGVLMSIDGSPDVQDAQRPSKNGTKNSEIIAHWARSMLRTRPKTNARATIHPNHVHRVRASYEYLRSLGFVNITFAASDYPNWNAASISELERQLMLCAKDIRSSLRSGGGVAHITAIQYYLNKLVVPRKRGAPVDYLKQPCGAGKGYMMVDYSGDVWPCHRFDGADTDRDAGGVFRLANIYEDGFHTRLHKAFVDFDHSTMQKPACRTCAIEPACGGFCPAANFSDTGSIYTPHDNYCAISNMQYRVAESIYADAQCDGTVELLEQTVMGAVDDGR